MKVVATNRKARHLYEILDTLEAGLVLTGPEIKAVRAGEVSLPGSFARLLWGAVHPRGVQADSRNKTVYTPGVYKQGVYKQKHGPELYWVGGTISATDGDPTRSRKLLVHRRELDRLIGKLQEKGLTLVPLRLYLKRGVAKLELGLGKGKKLHDKRQALREKSLQRDAERAQRD